MPDDTDESQVDQLVTKLLPLLTPLLTAEIKTSTDGETKTCGCKCEMKIKTLQQHYERLMKALQGYKDQVDTWKTKVRTLQSDINAASAKRLKEMKQIRTSITKIEEFTATHTAMKNSIQQLDALKKAQAEEIRKIKENVAKKTEFDATEIQDSQKFINEQFEKLREDNRAPKRQVDTEGSSLQNQIY